MDVFLAGETWYWRQTVWRRTVTELQFASNVAGGLNIRPLTCTRLALRNRRQTCWRWISTRAAGRYFRRHRGRSGVNGSMQGAVFRQRKRLPSMKAGKGLANGVRAPAVTACGWVYCFQLGVGSMRAAVFVWPIRSCVTWHPLLI